MSLEGQYLAASNKGGALHRPTIFQDRVHGQIKFHPAICRLIDTPHVQRLRNVKQLGPVHLVYPGATHTRFEHALGVAHLAGHLFDCLVANAEDRDSERQGVFDTFTPEERKRDRLCVMIAGLCHDLGHGPFSHAFEEYVNASRRRRDGDKAIRWHHEDQSGLMLDDMWREHSGWLAKDYGFKAVDWNFIKLLVRGLESDAPWPQEDVGRPANRRFLTDIVANKRSGLDVDKLDYLLRDRLACFGDKGPIHVDRLFQGALAMEVNSQWQICYDAKLDGDIEAVFVERAQMHAKIYQHRVTCTAHLMYVEAFLAADSVGLITDGEDRQYRLSETVESVEAFLRTNDWVECLITMSSDPDLKESRRILEAINSRNIYRSIGKCRPPKGLQAMKENLITRELLVSHLPDWLSEKVKNWEGENGREAVHIIKAVITSTASGMKMDANPLDQIAFFNDRTIRAGAQYLEQKRYTASNTDMQPAVTLYAVARMPLTNEEQDAFGIAFKECSHELGFKDCSDFGTHEPKTAAVSRMPPSGGGEGSSGVSPVYSDASSGLISRAEPDIPRSFEREDLGGLRGR